jgi:sugar phosphate isomerase/epimerase
MAHQPTQAYPSLTKSYKGLYPFKLGTTSFIYPDHYLPNVKLVGPFVDEIELLLFESGPAESLLPKSVIEDLMQLSRDLSLTYNIHLPTDISIGDRSAARQQHTVDTLVRIVEQTMPLSPTAYALHIPFGDIISDPDAISRRQDIVYRSLEKILAAGIPGELIAVETLDYPLEIIDQILSELDLAVCMDIGHLIIHGIEIQPLFNRYADKIAIIHLHGVEGHQDHLALDRLSEEWMGPVLDILNKFSGSVSIEVFSFENLSASLNYLEQYWSKNHYKAGNMEESV